MNNTDPLTSRPLGDPVVAVRLGLAAAVALTIGHFCLDPSSQQMIYGLAGGLSFGSALSVMVWCDGSATAFPLRALKAAFFALAARTALLAWLFNHLETKPTDAELARFVTWNLWLEWPRILGMAVALLLASRFRGDLVVGIAVALPLGLGDGAIALRLDWSPGGIAISMIAVAAMIPVAERALVRLDPRFRESPV